MSRILIKVRGDGSAIKGIGQAFGAASVRTKQILKLDAEPAGPGIAASQGAVWLAVDGMAGAENPWDQAHEVLAGQSRLSASTRRTIVAIEPDPIQQWVVEPYHPGTERPMGMQKSIDGSRQDDSGGQALGPRPAWHLDEDFSQLKKARALVGDRQSKVCIAHLDTGYDPEHVTLPRNLARDRQANFLEGENPKEAMDPPPSDIGFNNHGHGAGTLSILAGAQIDGAKSGIAGFNDDLGGAPHARIIPIRIADSVVRFTNGTIVQGIEHALAHGAHVLSMSMGGVGSNALVDAINKAYEHGLVMVTAAGNNYSGVPSPKTTVFPARFKRVLAACGVMADGRAYAGLALATMQGNYGPHAKMDTALGAFTPNVPWARHGSRDLVRLDGAGTSAATPQIAAAAALWIAQHWDAVMAYPAPWMRVEAVRRALFDSAGQVTARMGKDETRQKIGRGTLRAADALAILPMSKADLVKLAPAEPSWSWLNLLFGEGGVSIAQQGAEGRLRQSMLKLELTQMAHTAARDRWSFPVPERDDEQISATDRNRYLEAALDLGRPSKPLRETLEKALSRKTSATVPDGASGPPRAGGAASVATAGGDAPPPSSGKQDVSKLASRMRQAEPPRRRLRVYALDPSLAKQLDTVAINETTLVVPWDDKPNTDDDLLPGPVGEYIEVVDIDPASDKVYEPVDLNDKQLLAQNGLVPSEGDPKFHQQMVYAVAMRTIGAFEEALGRRALWSRHLATLPDGRSQQVFVPRLRIYPHALRKANAYYSPAKKALLFGYFRAESRETDATAPGTVVFTCLSSDIIAHETAHALLDGLHRGYQEASNPDVPSFHEAFADIVALFQHFAIPELVNYSIGKSRANLATADLLGGLAQQFGEGTNIGGALRNYVSAETDRLRYSDNLEIHARGAILVRAIYDAFIAIVGSRTADLLRISTGGSGVLPDGALHPDLVNRLTSETCKTARHFLRICVRALDYCPPVDITFGDYLRAMITADVDAMPEDPYGYRTAIMQNFRRRGIIPHDVLTMSVEALTWNVAATNGNAPGEDPGEPGWLSDFLAVTDFGLDRRSSRFEMFLREEANRWRLWRAMRRHFRSLSGDPKAAARAMADFGLLPDIPRYNEDGTLHQPLPGRGLKPGDTTFEVRSVRTARRSLPDGPFRTDIVVVIQQRKWEPLDPAAPEAGGFWHRGGATLIIQQHKAFERPRYPHNGEQSEDGDDSLEERVTPQLSGFKGRIRYAVTKNMSSKRRLEKARDNIGVAGSHGSLRELYFGRTSAEPFAMIHSDAQDDHHE